MSRESFRIAVYTQMEALKATWSAFPLIVEYDNQLIVDTQKQTNPFINIEIHYISGEQASLGINPGQRDYGQLHIAAVVKENTGVTEANNLLDHFVPFLRMRTFAGARMHGSSPQKKNPFKGWVYFPVLIPFDVDTLT